MLISQSKESFRAFCNITQNIHFWAPMSTGLQSKPHEPCTNTTPFSGASMATREHWCAVHEESSFENLLSSPSAPSLYCHMGLIYSRTLPLFDFKRIHYPILDSLPGASEEQASPPTYQLHPQPGVIQEGSGSPCCPQIHPSVHFKRKIVPSLLCFVFFWSLNDTMEGRSLQSEIRKYVWQRQIAVRMHWWSSEKGTEKEDTFSMLLF